MSKEEKFAKACPESAKIIGEEKHPSPKIIKDDSETIHEIKEIMDILGKSHSKGNVTGDHNNTILSYLRQKNCEAYAITKAKLAWLTNIGQRYVQENYLDGIEAFGIIEIFNNEYNVKHWRWIGIKALRNNGSEK